MMTNNNSLWINKYEPKKIKELCTNSKAVLGLREYVKNFESNNGKSCAIVTGEHGTGKTVSVNVVLNELDYTVKYIDFANVREKDISNNIRSVLLSGNVIDIIEGNNMKKTAIVVDELQSISSNNEKKYILELQKINDEQHICPIIFICNNQHNKICTDLKKKAINIRFYKPFPLDLKKILMIITTNEGVRIRKKEIIDKIIELSQLDIRRLIHILEDIHYAYKGKLITEEILNDYSTISQKKDTDNDLYTATNQLIYESVDIDKSMKMYESDKVKLPLMVHQNYINAVTDNFEQGEALSKLHKISQMLSDGDVIENYIYGEQTWSMQEIHGFYSCSAPSFYISDNNQDDNVLSRTPLIFTTDLNKTSIKQINKKNISKADKFFKNMGTLDYIYISQILTKYIEEDKIQECIALTKDYNISFQQIELLLKIDKIKDTTVNITARNKREFTRLLENN